MTVAELAGMIRSAGVKLAAGASNGLRYDAPAGTLTPELRGHLIARKRELLALLAAEAAAGFRVGELVVYAASGIAGEVVNVAPDAIAVRWLGRGTEARYAWEEAGRWLARRTGPTGRAIGAAAGRRERHPGAELVASLEGRGLRVRTRAGRLLIGPADLVDDASRALVEAHRALILAWLDGGEAEKRRTNMPAGRGAVRLERVDDAGHVAWRLLAEDGRPAGTGLHVSTEAAELEAHARGWRLVADDRTTPRAAAVESPEADRG